MASRLTCEEFGQRVKTLEKELADHKSRYKSNLLNSRYLEDILNNTNLPIYLKDADYKYIFVNRQFESVSHLSYDHVQGKDDFEIFPGPIAQLFRSQDEEVVKCRFPVEFEETIPLPDGVKTFMTAKFPLIDNEGRVEAVGGVCTDITARKNAEEALLTARNELEQRIADRTDQLNQKTEKLMETNIALKVLLEKREEDRKELGERVHFNVEKLIHPYLEKLKIRCKDDLEQSLLKIIQSNLDEIISPFIQNHKNGFSSLTPAQIQIANLIKQGQTSKEIASLLNLSPSTIACHRQEIRKRLSLSNNKTNLRTALITNS